MSTDANSALQSLLLSLFGADELRRFLSGLDGGRELVAGLPGSTASPAQIAFEATRMLVGQGFAGDPGLWDAMLRERPRRRPDIDRVKAQFEVGAAATPGTGPSGTPKQTPPASDDVLTVLLVSASPNDKERLRVDKEFARIIRTIRGATYGARLNFVQLQAARWEDLRRALLEHKPHILHISSHGKEDGSLVFEADGNNAALVSKRRFLELLDALSDNLRLVVLNACHSEAVAVSIPPTIDLAIGMSDAVVDEPAIAFAVGFYESIAFGKSVETAFKVARAELEDVDNAIPQLFPTKEDDARQKRKQPLLAP